MPRFFIHTFGCRVNRVESDQIAAKLLLRGWQQAPSMQDADATIINTCTVTGEADSKNRKAIRQALKRTSGPVIVTGCSANLKAAEYDAMDGRVTCETDKDKVAAVACSALQTQVAQECDASLVAYGDGFRTRSGIKIQDGCNNACTFCIVHTARGKARSVAADEVVAQARELVSAGAPEIVLVGIDSGAYNDNGLALDGLIKRLLNETNAPRIRLSSIEPQSITDGLIELMATSEGRLCRHLHVAMQSGSSKVLKEMARHYSADQFAALVARMRAATPSLALSTDVIVGFPGETDADFEQTCQMVKDCRFMKLHIFPYSKRPGTPAAARTDQIAPELKAERAARLAALGDELAAADRAARIGTTEGVVIESSGKGTSESFHTVICSEELPSGTLQQLHITGSKGDALIAN